MGNMFALAIFTFRGVLQMPAYRVLLIVVPLLVLLSVVFSQLFLLEISKVFIDFLWIFTSLLGVSYSLVIGAGILGQDLSGHLVYLFLPHMSRQRYLLGRMLGLFWALVLLLLMMMLTSLLALWWVNERMPGVFLHAPVWWSPVALVGLALIQSLTILVAVAFILSWASGLVEALLFSSAFTLLSYLLPSVFESMRSADVMARMPAWLVDLLRVVDYLFPDMTGGRIALSLAHHLSLDWHAVGWFVVAQVGYSVMIFAFGLLLFVQRDL